MMLLILLIVVTAVNCSPVSDKVTYPSERKVRLRSNSPPLSNDKAWGLLEDDTSLRVTEIMESLRVTKMEDEIARLRLALLDETEKRKGLELRKYQSKQHLLHNVESFKVIAIFILIHIKNDLSAS